MFSLKPFCKITNTITEELERIEIRKVVSSTEINLKRTKNNFRPQINVFNKKSFLHFGPISDLWYGLPSKHICLTNFVMSSRTPCAVITGPNALHAPCMPSAIKNPLYNTGRTNKVWVEIERVFVLFLIIVSIASTV